MAAGRSRSPSRRGVHSLVVPEGSVPFAPAAFCGGARRTGGALVDREAAVLTCRQTGEVTVSRSAVTHSAGRPAGSEGGRGSGSPTTAGQRTDSRRAGPVTAAAERCRGWAAM